jgi:methionyl-tRNA formyltransferase
MGTSPFAVPSLQQLLRAGHRVVGVVTQPDRPQGRKRQLTFTPVKAAALAAGLPVWQPTSVKQPEALAELTAQPVDFIVVAAYGQIIPRALLDYPRYGCVNVHASLLPAYRGAAPIRRTIMAGDATTGVTVMAMEEGLDTGDILAQAELAIEDKNAGQLEAELAVLGAELLLRTLPELQAGSIIPLRQDEAASSYAARLTGADEILDFSRPAAELYNQIRGLSPDPGAYTYLRGQRLKVFSARPAEDLSRGLPGEILAFSAAGFLVQTGRGALELLEVQKEGKARMSGRELARGINDLTGQNLGERA